MAYVTFDGPNSLIIVDPGITELDVQIDLYSDWKEWSLLSDNLKFQPAFRSVGGDPISDTRNLGATFFLINGWRIRPDEVDHRLTITGNLFTDPAGFSPVVPTLGDFNVIVEYSTSNLIDTVAAVANVDVARTQYLIESARGHHGGYGSVFFWDPVNGDDSNDGTTPDTAVEFFSAAHDLAVAGRHDVIFLLTGTVEVEWDEALVITKRDLSVREVGHGVVIKPTTAGVDAVTIDAEGVHLQSLTISTSAGGGDGIFVNNESALVEDCDISSCSGHGILVNGNASRSKLLKNLVYDCDGNGIRILDTAALEVEENDVHDCLNGIKVEATSPTEMHVDIYGNRVADNTEYGVSVGVGVQKASIGQHNVLSHNTLGDILDLGTDTYVDDEVRAQNVWAASTASPAASSYGERLDVAVSTRAAPGDEMDLEANAVDAAAVAPGALTQDVFAVDVDTYQAKIWFFDDNVNVTDRYTTIWFKNGQPVTTGITFPLIQVYKVTDGTDLIAETAMTQIGSTGTYKYDEATNIIADGAGYIAIVKATIAGSQRLWYQPVGRDSA